MTEKLIENFERKRKLDKLLSESDFSILTIRLGNESFNGNKAVLLDSFPVFESLLNSSSEDNVIELDVNRFHSSIILQLIKYAYTGCICLTYSNSKYISMISSFLGEESLYKAAIEFLEESLEEDNIFEISHYAIENNLTELLRSCNFYVKRIFEQNFEYHEQNINLNDWKLLISLLHLFEQHKTDFLMIRKEDLYSSIIRWIRLNESKRLKYLCDLLDDIPLPSLPYDFLVRKVKNERLIIDCEDLRKQLPHIFPSEISKELLFVLGGTIENSASLDNDQDDLSMDLKEPENKICKKSLLEYRKMEENRSLSVYCSIYKRWWNVPMSSNCSNRSAFSCVVIGHKIYVAGGTKGRSPQIVNSFEFYDNNLNIWKQLPSMKYKRKDFGMAVLNGDIYVTGGRTLKKFGKYCNIRYVEKYSIENNEWYDVEPMKRGRNGHELVELNNYLFAIGGSDNGETKTVERYDPKTDRWQDVRETIKSFCHFSSAVYDNKIFIVDHKKMEFYDFKKNLWFELKGPIMQNSKKRMKMVVFNDRLLIMGGHDDSYWPHDDVKAFDYFRKEWYIPNDIPKLDVPRSLHCLAVIRHFTNT